MNDYSYGIVPLKYEDGRWYVFIIRHPAGHWAMPKGHPEQGETPFEAAKRELKEETNLVVDEVLSDKQLIERYTFRSRNTVIYKTVAYFVARVSGTPQLQTEELIDGKWVLLTEAHTHVTFQEAKNLLTETKKILQV